MRLKKEEILVLKQTVKDLSNDAKLFLFGSRVDNTKRGGDIVLDTLTPKKTFTKIILPQSKEIL